MCFGKIVGPAGPGQEVGGRGVSLYNKAVIGKEVVQVGRVGIE